MVTQVVKLKKCWKYIHTQALFSRCLYLDEVSNEAMQKDIFERV